MAQERAQPAADYPVLVLPELLRAVRRFACLSQRELAEAAGLPKSTIDRLESGRTTDPSLSTLQRVLGAAGYALAVVGDDGGEVSYLNAPGPQLDRAGRHLPAHLERRPLDDTWWGWERIAWEFTDHPRPEWIYFMRRRLPTWPGFVPGSLSLSKRRREGDGDRDRGDAEQQRNCGDASQQRNSDDAERLRPSRGCG